MKRRLVLALGVAATLGSAFVWHGPLGNGSALADRIDQRARTMLDHYEMTAVAAHAGRDPLNRRVLLSGPADDFQRGEIKRLVEEQPGVERAVWAGRSSSPGGVLPLLVEAWLLAGGGFAIGLLLAYLFHLRRRAGDF